MEGLAHCKAGNLLSCLNQIGGDVKMCGDAGMRGCGDVGVQPVALLLGQEALELACLWLWDQANWMACLGGATAAAGVAYLAASSIAAGCPFGRWGWGESARTHLLMRHSGLGIKLCGNSCFALTGVPVLLLQEA